MLIDNNSIEDIEDEQISKLDNNDIFDKNKFDNLINKICELYLDISPIDDYINNNKNPGLDIEFISSKRDKIDKSILYNKIEAFITTVF